MSPRINIDDSLETHEEFWVLLKALEGDRDRALGYLVRFFRIAQAAFVKRVPITETEIRAASLGAMIESGWAVPTDGGFEAKGAQKHFEWIRDKREAGKAGGKVRAKGPRDEKGRLLPTPGTIHADAGDVQTDAGNFQALSTPLTPSLYTAPVQLQKKKHPLLEGDIWGCRKEWAETLVHYQIEKDPAMDDVEIARLVQRHGPEKAKLALRGMRFEAKTATFDPAKNCFIARLGKTANVEKFVNLGAQNRETDRRTFQAEGGEAIC